MPPLTIGERTYAQASARFIQHYDQRTYPRRPIRSTLLVRLKYVLDESGTTPAVSAKLLGVSLATVSLLLRGKRKLTVDGIRRLSKRFKVDASYFI